MHKLADVVHWNVRDIQIRSRKLNDRIIRFMNEAHVTFVKFTEVREQVKRHENDIDVAPFLAEALAAHERAKSECERLMAERAELLAPFTKKDSDG